VVETGLSKPQIQVHTDFLPLAPVEWMTTSWAGILGLKYDELYLVELFSVFGYLNMYLDLSPYNYSFKLRFWIYIKNMYYTKGNKKYLCMFLGHFSNFIISRFEENMSN